MAASSCDSALAAGEGPAASGLRLSEAASRFGQSEIRSMTVECERLGGINLAQGVCDTPLPPSVQRGAIAAIEAGHNSYTRMDGIAPLRRALSRKLRLRNQIDADPETQVLVTSGATGALHAACLALFDPGDEVILFEPFYGYHLNTLAALRLRPIVLPLARGTWDLDLAALASRITPRTRGILINTPCNPCGKVFTREELEAIGQVATENDLFILSDEIYEHFVFGDGQHVSPASLPGLARRTITISGFSKTFSVTGWRIGYLVADAEWLPSMAHFHDLTYVCSPSPAQYGAAAGIAELGDDFYRGLAKDYGGKRDRLCRALEAVGLTPFVPRGAYYVLADATTVPGERAVDKARALLAQTGVASVPGSAFHGPGRGGDLLRFCFAKSDAAIAEACERLGRFRPRARASG